MNVENQKLYFHRQDHLQLICHLDYDIQSIHKQPVVQIDYHLRLVASILQEVFQDHQ